MTLPSSKTFHVAAIKDGTVLDHIQAGKALRIIKFLNLAAHQKRVSVGINLPGNKIPLKDLIKVEDWELSPKDVNRVAILSPEMTVNIIKDYEVIKKFEVIIPKSIESIFPCPNPVCITNHEQVASRFETMQRSSLVSLTCYYCHKQFLHK